MIISKKIHELSDEECNHCGILLMNSADPHPFNDIRLHQRVSMHYAKNVYGEVLYYYEKNECMAYLIAYVATDKKVNSYTSPYQKSLITYGGIIGPPHEDVSLNFVKELKRFLGLFSPMYIKTLPKADINAFTSVGFNVNTKLTLYIDTKKNVDDLWKSIDNRIKRNISKAISSKVRIEIVNPETLEDILQHYEVYRDVCNRSGLSLHKIDYYRDILSNNYYQHSMIFYAYIDDKVVSSMSLLYGYGYFIPWFGGTLSEYRSTHAGSLIYWEIIKYASLHGYATYDFLGLDHDTIGFYKRGFGGEEVPVYHVTNRPLGFRVLNKFHLT